jgi:hypothetical protein
MRLIFLFLLFLAPSVGWAQVNDDYFQSESERDEQTKGEKFGFVEEKFPRATKLTLDAFGDISYTGTNDLYQLFDKVGGGVGGQTGLDLRIRLYHKIAVTVGAHYANYPIHWEYNYIDTLLGSGHVVEKARIEYLGFQVGLRIEFSKRVWLGLDFSQSYFFSFKPSEQSADFGSNGVFTFDSPDNSIFSYNRQKPKDIFGMGLRFGLRYPLMDVLHIKPFLAINIATTGIIHSGAFGNKILPPGSYGEVSPSHVHLKLGVYFEMALLSPKPRRGK